MTTIIDVQWHAYRLPLRSALATAHGVITAREGAIVEVTTAEGISGIGEIAPLPGFGFGGGTLSDALTRLPTLARHLRGKTLVEALALLHTHVVARGDAGWLVALAGARSALACGLEIALLDALGKAEGYGISTLLFSASPTIHRGPTGPRPGVQVNAVVGARATEAAVAGAKEALAAGFGCVKLKVGWGHSIQEEVERVAAVREAVGPDIHLRLDANEAWNLEQAIAILSHCVHYDIQYVEQPIQARDLMGLRTLRRAMLMPIAADEALYDLDSARRILDSEAVDILIVKPQLIGGLRVGQHIIQEAEARGIHSVITSTIEAGIGLVAALHLAVASPAITLECGLATLHLLVDDLLTNDLPICDGYLAVPTGSGLGIVLDREALDKYGVSVGADSSCPSTQRSLRSAFQSFGLKEKQHEYT